MVKAPAKTLSDANDHNKAINSEKAIDKPSENGSRKVRAQNAFKYYLKKFANTEAGRVAILKGVGECTNQAAYWTATRLQHEQLIITCQNLSSAVTIAGFVMAGLCAKHYFRRMVQHFGALKSALKKPATLEQSGGAPAPGKGQDPETNLKELKDLARASLPPAKKATSDVPACFQPLKFLNQPLEFDFALLGHSQGQEQIISPSFLKVKIYCCPQYGVSNAEELKQHFDRAMNILPARIATDVVPILARKHVLAYLGLKEDSADANQKFAEKLVKQWQHAPVVVNH
jgi:hypothetical protein